MIWEHSSLFCFIKKNETASLRCPPGRQDDVDVVQCTCRFNFVNICLRMQIIAPPNLRLGYHVTRQRTRVFLYSNWKHLENKIFALKFVYKMENALWEQIKETQH